MTHFGQHKASSIEMTGRWGPKRYMYICVHAVRWLALCAHVRMNNQWTVNTVTDFLVHYSTSLYILHTYPKHSKKCLNVPFLATKSAVLSTMSVGHRSGRQLQERSSLRCKHRKLRYTQQEPHFLAFAILQFLITYSIQKQRGRIGRYCHSQHLLGRQRQRWFWTTLKFFLVPSV